ncbi:MAG: hypothetical protein IPM69_15350 [Ignavibacteria bacterium]|nr:hypothetical protein [Ignavibacteria bacterium]
MKKTLTYLIVFIISLGVMNATYQRKKKPVKKKKATIETIKRVVVASVQLGDNVPSTLERKVDAAIGLACFASNRYSSISFAMRDSVVKKLQNEGKDASALEVATELKADRIVFLQINRIANILRVELAVNSGDKFAQTSKGEGYSLLKYHQNDTSIIYDPSLLEAIQRAFAAAEKDSMMFAAAEKDMRVFPAPPLAIVGIEFKDSLKIISKLFDLKSQPVNGYDAVLTIFQAAKESTKYAVFDMDTRDTIYALENLVYVENNQAPSVVELKVLTKFGIYHCITGSLSRTEESTVLTLQLCTISTNGALTKIRAERAIISDEDNISELRQSLTRLTRKLLKING